MPKTATKPASKSAKSSTSATKPTQLDKLNSNLTVIRKQMVRQNSLRLSFARGLFTGLGATVGVTFVVAFFAFVVLQVARALGFESGAQDFLQLIGR